VAIARVGTELYNLLRLGFLKAESAGSDRAIKAATTKYNKTIASNPEFARVESIRLNGDTDRSVQDLGERTIITPESLMGNVLVPVAGDRTLTGNALTKSQGFGLLDNVDIKGGPKFMMEHKDKGLGWASMQGAAKQKQKNFDLAARETDNPNIVGVYNAMGDEANNFATPIADVIINQLSGNKIPKEVASEFDNTIRKANPNWVGINHPQAKSQLMGTEGYPKKGAGALRSRFTKLASMAKYRNEGFPSRERIRDDVVEPELLNADRGASGFTMFDAVPNGETIPFTENPSYDTGILGQFRGGLTESVPAEIMFPDVFNELSKKVNKAGNTLSRGEILGSLVMDPKLYQKADQKWLDNIAGYLEKNQGKLGASMPTVAVGLLGAGAMTGSGDADAGNAPLDQLYSPQNMGLMSGIQYDGDVGSIKAATNPMLQSMAGGLRKVDTPIGNPFESASNVLNRWAYGEGADNMDLLGMGLESLDFIPAVAPVTRSVGKAAKGLMGAF
tara:strand:- start:322 stop:1833 length:1512 start_codon:yes stop_codon:yes gene_type:complete